MKGGKKKGKRKGGNIVVTHSRCLMRPTIQRGKGGRERGE